MMQLRHFPQCQLIPEEDRMKLAAMKRGICAASASSPDKPHISSRQQYWVDSAHKLGFMDTVDGIRFAAEEILDNNKRSLASFFSYDADNCGPVIDLPADHAILAPSKRIKRTRGSCMNLDTPERYTSHHNAQNNGSPAIPAVSPDLDQPDIRLKGPLNTARVELLTSLIGDSDLVRIDDIDLVPDYLMIAMAQMEPCFLEDWDRVGCYRDRQKGFKGMCCKHCAGQQGHGKFFPASVGGLSQTTTAQTILKHVAFKCEKCPTTVREAVLKYQDDSSLKEATNRTVNDTKPKYGSRKFFFQRVWSRLHGEIVPSSMSSSEKHHSESQLGVSLSTFSVSSSCPGLASTNNSISDDDSASDIIISVEL